MDALRFVDANCMIGRRPSPLPGTIHRLEDFLADFEHYDLDAALVHHAAAVSYAPDHGNRRLLEEIAGRLRLLPQWVVLPHHTFEMAPPRALVAEMLERNVRAARIYPRSHGFGTSEPVCGELFRELQEHRVPLFVDAAELDLGGAADLCRRYPDLPVVLCGVGWEADRLVYALLGDVPNLHLDTWAFQGHRAYERFAQTFGSERLLFSTHLPDHSPGAARMMTVYEAIDDEARRDIAAGNLLRLLAGVRGARGALPEPAPYRDRTDDAIAAEVRLGRPLRAERVIDAHAHLGHPGCMGVYPWAIPHSDAAGLVGTMDRLGIDLACASSWGGLCLGDLQGNDVVIAAEQTYPDRIVPYGCVNPNYPELIEPELERVFATGLVHGFKPYPKWHLVPLTDARNAPLLEFCDRHRRPVLCHMYFDATSSATPEQVDYLAPRYPGASFLCGHSGQCWPMAQEVAKLARRHANVFAEITYPTPLCNMVEYLAREAGAEKVLFGTDCVMQDAAPQLGWVAWARLPLESKRLILGGNMAGILTATACRVSRVSGNGDGVPGVR